mgnify:CR=1 FL=1
MGRLPPRQFVSFFDTDGFGGDDAAILQHLVGGDHGEDAGTGGGGLYVALAAAAEEGIRRAGGGG